MCVCFQGTWERAVPVAGLSCLQSHTFASMDLPSAAQVVQGRRVLKMKLSQQSLNIAEIVFFFSSLQFFFHSFFPNALPSNIPGSVGACHVRLFLTAQRITVAGTKDSDGGEVVPRGLEKKEMEFRLVASKKKILPQKR